MTELDIPSLISIEIRVLCIWVSPGRWHWRVSYARDPREARLQLKGYFSRQGGRLNVIT